MKSRGSVAVIGGSMAGLFAAISLRSLNFDVNIFERSAGDLANGGAGIATHSELYDALETAGVELRAEMGIQSNGRVMFNNEGKISHRVAMKQIMTSWGLIYRFLRKQIPKENYHSEHCLQNLSFSGKSVTAVFTNGDDVTTDWLIGADGARSQVRKILAPTIRPIYAGYLGWRGLIDENLIPKEVVDQLSLQMAFGMAPGGHWLGYLVAGPDDALNEGNRWYNWGWYRTADEDSLQDHLTDTNGEFHHTGIPAHLIRKEIINAMRLEAKKFLAPQIEKVIESTTTPFLQPMYDFSSKQLVFERAILIGDAAFTARPHVGMGVSKAAFDASSLAQALSKNNPISLKEWERSRLKFGRAAVQWGRDLGSYLGPKATDPASQKKAEYYMRPETLLSVTAASEPQRYLRIEA